MTAKGEDIVVNHSKFKDVTQYMGALIKLSSKGKAIDRHSGILTDEADTLLMSASSIANKSNPDDLNRITNWIGSIGGFSFIGNRSRLDLTKELGDKYDLSAKQIRDRIKAAMPDPKSDVASNGSLEEMVENMNKDHSSTIMGGKHVIVRIKPDTNYPDMMTTELIRPHELAGVYANELYEVGVSANGTPKFADKVNAWLAHPKCRTYRNGVFFLPSPPATEIPQREGMLNLWDGFDITPAEGDWSLIDWHIHNIIACGKNNMYEYILNWCAHIIQFPYKKTGVALVFRSINRTGKGMFANFVKSLFGKHGFSTSHSNQIVGNFNKHLAMTCLLFADEAMLAGNKKQENALKSLITDPDFAVEAKGFDAVAMPNRLNIVMATNEDWGVATNKDDERFCVCDVSPAMKGNRKYFSGLKKVMSSVEGKAAFIDAMMKRDISDFIPSEIPLTEGLKDQRRNSLPPVWLWWLDCLERGYVVGDVRTGTSPQWHDQLQASEMYKIFLTWCDDMKLGQYDRVTQTKFGRQFGEIYPNKVRVNGLQSYKLGTLQESIALTHEKLGV